MHFRVKIKKKQKEYGPEYGDGKFSSQDWQSSLAMDAVVA